MKMAATGLESKGSKNRSTDNFAGPEARAVRFDGVASLVKVLPFRKKSAVNQALTPG